MANGLAPEAALSQHGLALLPAGFHSRADTHWGPSSHSTWVLKPVNSKSLHSVLTWPFEKKCSRNTVVFEPTWAPAPPAKSGTKTRSSGRGCCLQESDCATNRQRSSI